jgi:cytochrome c553
MNFLERIPTRWLIVGAALACLALWAAPSSAQTTGDPAQGKLLFEDTPNQSGQYQLGTCTNCHTVQDRRSQIATGSKTGAPFADISFDRAISHFGNAIATQGAMSQFKNLDGDQVQNIAAYLADTPKVTATGLSTSNALAFDASASGVSVTKNVTINHSIATTDNLKIVSVTLDTGATAFTRSGACNNVMRSPAGTCTFSISYTPTTVSNETKNLTITLQQGSVTFTRSLTLNGSVAGGTTPPPATPSSGEDSGGGALGWMWLTGLGLATAVLSRRRHA